MTKHPSALSEESKEKIFAVMAYLWVLCILPLILKKDNPFVLAHGKQGLVIFVGVVGILIISILMDWILRPGLFLAGALSFAGIVAVLMGRELRLPVIAGIADKISL